MLLLGYVSDLFDLFDKTVQGGVRAWRDIEQRDILVPLCNIVYI